MDNNKTHFEMFVITLKSVGSQGRLEDVLNMSLGRPEDGVSSGRL